MRKQQTTAIVLGERTCEWTTLARTKDRVAVVSAGRFDFEPAAPAEAAEAPAGDTPPAASNLAERFQAQCGKLSGDLALGLPSHQILLRVVSLPVADEGELRSMVALQLDKFSPFPVDSMVAGHEVLSARDDSRLVLIGAAQEKAVSDARDRLPAAAGSPTRVDAIVLGYWRLLQDAGEVPPQGRHVILLLDGPQADIVVADGGVPVLFRSLGEGVDLTRPDAETELAGELSYTLMSMELESGAGAPAGMAVWQRGSPSTRLAEVLRSAFACEVKVRSLDDLPAVSEGLARRALDPAALDLTPQAWKESRHEKASKRRLGKTAGLLFLAWLVGVGGFLGWMAVEKALLARVKAERDRWFKPAQEVRDVRRRVYAIRRYMDTTHSALECLREITSLQPEGVTLTGLTYKKGESVRISGEASDVNQVYEFKNKIDGSKLFLESALIGPTLDNRRGRAIFSIDMRLPGGEE